MLEKESVRLAVAINNREFNEIDIAQAFITSANAKLTVLKKISID